MASLAARAAKRINAATRMALTGTPMENNVSELWSLFDFCLPGYLPPLRPFLQRYDEGQKRRGPADAHPALPDAPAEKDVMAELPDKLETTLYAQMYRTSAGCMTRR